MANWQAYRALKAESMKVGWPLAYQTDLTKHDRAALSVKDAPERFVWILRNAGTHLLQDNGRWESGVLRYLARAESRARFYVFENGELREVERDEARDHLARWAVKARREACAG